jgi:hypothetical protein
MGRPTTMAVFVAGGVLLAIASCRTPTKVTLVVSTDVVCADLRGVGIAVGEPASLETAPATTTTEQCAPGGDIGTLVIVPSGGAEDKFGVRVVAGVGKSPEDCVQSGYKGGCIVARRSMNFLPHTELTLPIPLTIDCLDVACDATHTCVNGACVPAEIIDPSTCVGPAGCALLPTGSGPGGGGGSGGSGGTGGIAGSAGDGGGGTGGGTVCTPPTADCDADPGCETDLDTDATSCGACGHDCLGGECVGAMCQPVVLGTAPDSPRHVVVDATNLYFATSGPVSGIWKVPLDGSAAPALLAGQQAFPGCLVLDGPSQSLYWANYENAGAVRRFQLPAGPLQQVAPANNGKAVAVDGPDLFFLETAGTGAMLTAPIDGSALPTVLAPSISWPWAIVVDDGNIYVGTNTGNGSIFVMPRQGGAMMPLAPAKFDYGLAVDATDVFYSENDAVSQVSKAGGTPVPLGSSAHPYALAIDATRVYWTSNSDGEVLMAPKGGATPATTIATGQANVYGIAVDANAVYWANNEPGGAVVKLAKPLP